MEVPKFGGASAVSGGGSSYRDLIPSIEPKGADGSITLCNYVNGHFVPAADGQYIDDFNPATGAPSAKIPRSKAADVEAAVAAAKAAFPAWRATTPAYRSAILNKIADAIEAWAPELAQMEAEDSGKSLKMASNIDIPRSVANLRFFAGQILYDETSAHEMPDAINYTTRVPIGVAGLITPWNLPLYLATWKIAPALATGNTVVIKPSEITPRTATALCYIIDKIGLPPGVFNLVHGLGSEVGQSLVAHPEVRLISFTGGTATGKIVAATAAPLFKKLSLELGGKNSTLVFDDIDLGTGVAGAVRSAFTNNGQVCLAGSRVFVQAGIYDTFVPKFIEAVKKLKCGPPLAPDTDVGPVSSSLHRDKILSYIQLARDEGGCIECGGGRPEGLGPELDGGFFISPTVVTGLPPTSRVSLEEIFGPVCTIHRFETEAEVIEMANVVKYGLAASVWTNNTGRAHRVPRSLEAGIIWVNTWLHRDLRTPFGGVKDSGVGREGGRYSLEAYTEYKNTCVYMGPLTA